MKRKTTKECIERLREVFGDTYDYSKVDYKSRHTKIELICLKHGGFFKAPCELYKGDGCRYCSDENRTVDLAGRQFGRITVIERYTGEYEEKYKRTRWRCKCSCGKENLSITSHALISGSTVGCGCYGREKLRESIYKHGECGTLLYKKIAFHKAALL